MDRRRLNLHNLVVVAVAASLLVMAAGMGVVAIDAASTAAHPPLTSDTSQFGATATWAGVSAVLLALLALVILRSPGWFASMLSAFVSILAAASGIWVVSGGLRLQATAQVGPIGVTMVADGIVLAVASAVCLIGSVAMWRLLPQGPRLTAPPMPPPTHQG